MTTAAIPSPQSLTGRLILGIGCWVLAMCLAACGRSDDAWDRVLESGVLRVGMDASFSPFETIAADGTLVGFDVDLARELGRRMGPDPNADRTSVAKGPALSKAEGPALSGAEGVEVEFVANLPYDGLYDALAVSRVDVVISALVINPDRMADFAYSTPYFDAGQVLVVRAPSATPADGEEPSPLSPPPAGGMNQGGGIEEMADLSGRSLAVEFGTQGDLEARRWERRLSDLTVAPYQTAAEAVAAVAAGEADAALVDHVSALAAPGAGSSLVIVGEPVVKEPYAVAVRQDSRRLLRAINDALKEMAADGTLEMLIAKWLKGESRTQ